MDSNMNDTNKVKDPGTMIMDTLVMLLEDQNGKKYEYRQIDNPKEETA